MTTPVPTPGNGAQNSPATEGAPGPGRVLLPALGIVALAVLGLMIVRFQGTTQKPPPPSNPGEATSVAEMRVGAVLPDFQLNPFKGDALAVSSLKSKVSLINFWATWCEACMVEMPSIIQLYRGYKDRGFDVVAVNLDTDPTAVLPRTMQKYGMTFNVYTDGDSKLADLFQVQAIPLSVVIDHNRKILMIENEGIDWNDSEFRATLEKWLAG